jgi:hypothetical protein
MTVAHRVRPPARTRSASSRHGGRIIFGLACLLLALVPAARAQQPFVTDDADVTDKGKFHLEFSNEFDLLQPAAFPGRRQNTATVELDYGLLKDVELDVQAPLIAIYNARGTSPRTAFGLGDTRLSVKYNFLKERDGSRRPALAVSFGVELPTGDADTQIGSGVTDYILNGIVQKALTKRTTWRVNGGVIFSGNTKTGAVGVGTRGPVYTGGTSFVRKFTHRLDLGAEVTGAFTGSADPGQKQLQAQVGGHFRPRGDKLSIDFGVIGGRFDASPRLGAQLGFSLDF